MKRPDLNRLTARRGMTIALGALVFVLAAWIYAKHVATRHARRAVDDLLMQHGLAAYVTYDDISASPFGSFVMRRVGIVVPGSGNVTIGRLAVSGLKQDDEGAVRAVSIDAGGISIPVLDVARGAASGDMLPAAVRDEVLAADIPTLKGRLSLGYAYDASERTLRLDGSGRAEAIGRFSVDMRLADVDPRLLGMTQQLAALARNKADGVSPMDALSILPSLPPVRLTRLDWTIDNGPLTERLAKIPATAVPQASAGGDVPPDLGAEFRRAGITSDDARKDARVLSQWRREGGTLSFETDIDSPVPLTVPGGLFGIQPAFRSPYDFLARTHATFSD